ncbi:MAG: transposase [Candidatus Ranarchaeia archaeon]
METEITKIKKQKWKKIIQFTSQQIRNKNGYVLLTKKIMKQGFPKLKIASSVVLVVGVHVVPFGDRYNIELIYNKKPQNSDLDKNHVLGIDLGLNNIVTTSNNKDNESLIIKGGVLKSINQYYNKKLGKQKSKAKKCNNKNNTNKLLKLHRKRNNKIKDFFHKTSRKLINQCIKQSIGKAVIGYNAG